MSETKKIRQINCRNRICLAYLCHFDGEIFYVENLEIIPKVKNTKKRLTKIIVCPRCAKENKVALKKNVTAEQPEKGESPVRKFLIFRSRF